MTIYSAVKKIIVGTILGMSVSLIAMEAPDKIQLTIGFNLQAAKGKKSEPAESKKSGSIIQAPRSRMGTRTRSAVLPRELMKRMTITANKDAKIEDVIKRQIKKSKHRCPYFDIANPQITKEMTVQQVRSIIGSRTLVVNCFSTIELKARIIFPFRTEKSAIEKESDEIVLKGRPSEKISNALKRSIKGQKKYKNCDLEVEGFKATENMQQVKTESEGVTLTIHCFPKKSELEWEEYALLEVLIFMQGKKEPIRLNIETNKKTKLQDALKGFCASKNITDLSSNNKSYEKKLLKQSTENIKATIGDKPLVINCTAGPEK